MSAWGGGYVTDIGYLMGYHPEQAPGHLALAALINGVASEVIERPEGLHYLELGSGLGFGPTLLGACNPSWRVTAIDFNPAHIAAGRVFAAEAGVENVTFLEADLATFAESPQASSIPEADVASLHGVWSWVAAPVRAGILRLLTAKVRAGGLVHVSYNALPGWQGAIGMQRLLREAGLRLAGRSDRQAEAGMGVVRALALAEATHLKAGTFVQRLLERLAGASVDYLAHEFMNGAWAPCFHADVAADFAGAKFTWVGSARLHENFPELMLTEAQRKEVARFDDPLMLELIKDICAGPALRQDVYVRGARRMSENERNRALARVTLALATRPTKFCYEIDLPAGKATLNREFYGAVVEALAQGPRTIGDLLALPEKGAHADPPEIAAMLVGTGQAAVVLRPAAGCLPQLDRFHAAASRRATRFDRLDRPIALASHRIGAGLTVPTLELMVLSRLASEGAAEPADWARLVAPGLEAERQEALGKEIARILEERTQIWRLCGVI